MAARDATSVPAAARTSAATELVDVGGAAHPGHRQTRRDTEAGVVEGRIEEVAAVLGRVHPGQDDLAGRGGGARAPSQVLAQRPPVGAVQIAGPADALVERGAAGGDVGEERL